VAVFPASIKHCVVPTLVKLGGVLIAYVCGVGYVFVYKFTGLLRRRLVASCVKHVSQLHAARTHDVVSPPLGHGADNLGLLVLVDAGLWGIVIEVGWGGGGRAVVNNLVVKPR